MSRSLLSMSVVLVLLAAVVVTTMAAAGKPNPVITVSPDGGLSDGEAVEVSGTGFQERQIHIAECGGADVTAHPVVGPVCTYFTYYVAVQSDADGNFAPVSFTVERTIRGTRYVNGVHDPEAASYDCLPLNDCFIKAYATTRGSRIATHPITFAP